MMTTTQKDFSAFSNDEWDKLLANSFFGKVPEGMKLPGFPPREVVERTNGRYNKSVMEQAARFHRLVINFAAKHDVKLTPETKILDFGCGWGRILRYFLKEIRPNNLFASDINKTLIDLCQESMAGFGEFYVNSELPPLPFAAQTFDIIYAQSVFSHLSKGHADAWAEELARVLRPRGLIFLTTLKENDLIAQRKGASSYRRSMNQIFSGKRDLISNYHKDGIAFVSTSKAYTNWGHAAISAEYAHKNWRQFGLEQIEWLETGYPQTVALLRGQG